MRIFSFVALLLTVPAVALPLARHHKDKLVIPLKTSEGQNAGTATFIQGKKDLTIKLNLENLPFGEHGVHIHQKALCDAPDFKTAGGHFNPAGKQHGTLNPLGHHNGDLPMNVSVGEDHKGSATFHVTDLSLENMSTESILANGGTSIVVHEKPDDMKTEPSGNSGNRIACGVIMEDLR